MDKYYLVAIVTLVSGLLCVWMSMMVSRAHAQAKIFPPQMTGDPLLERTARAHTNTLEVMPVFLPGLWLFALYWRPDWAAAIGTVWIIGRIAYFLGYRAAPEKRFPGFGIQALAVLALVLGSLGRVIYLITMAPSG